LVSADDVKEYARGAFEYIEGVGEVALGVFLCFYGGPMIDLTIKVLIFCGCAAGSYMGVE